MGAVLDDGDLVLLRDLVDLLHLGNLAAHVGEHEPLDLGARRSALLDLTLEVLHVHDVGFSALHVDGDAARVVDGRGHGGEGEAVGEDVIARLDAAGLECDEEGGAARVEADAVFEARPLRHVPLRQRGLRLDAGRVAEERAALHQLERALLPLLRDRIRRRE